MCAYTHTHINARRSVIAVQACVIHLERTNTSASLQMASTLIFQRVMIKSLHQITYIIYGIIILDNFMVVFQVSHLYQMYQTHQMIHAYQRIWCFIYPKCPHTPPM